MDDNFDEIINEGGETSSAGSSNKTNIYNKVSNAVGGTIETAGKTVERTGKTVKSTGKAVETTGKGVEAAGKATQAAGRATQAVGKGAQAAGKSAQAAGKSAQAAGQGLSAASDSAISSGAAASATGAGAIAGVPLIVLGAAGKAVGTGVDVAGKGMDVAGTGMDAAGKGAESAGKSAETAGKNIETAGKNIQSTGKNIQSTGNKIADAGKKVKSVGKDMKKGDEDNSLLPDSVKKALKGGQVASNIAEKTRKVIDTLSNPVKRTILISVVTFLLIIIMIAYILEPLTEAMDKIKTGADYVERLNNFMHGLGFENSKDAFYDELDFLELRYGGAVDEPLLMATLFYNDVFEGGDVIGVENDLTSTDDVNFYASTIMALINYAGKEAFTEEDANGLIYTANKVFRLKRLTHNMVDKTGDNLITVPLDEYVDINRSILDSDREALAKSFVSVLCCQLLLSMDISVDVVTKVREKLLPDYQGPLDIMLNNQYITKHDGMDSIINFGANTAYYIEDLINVFTDIKGIGITLTINGTPISINFGQSGESQSGFLDTIKEIVEGLSLTDIDVDLDIMITYSEYSLDEEGYFNYLKDTYIPSMPEFDKIVKDKDGNVIESKVDDVIENIKMLAKTWEEVYGDGGSAEYNDVCIGNIHPNLISELRIPIDLEDGAPINFSNKTAYGVNYLGKKHNGVDLNEESTGTTAGAPVYAIYDGTVRASTASNDYNDDDKNGLGGWVKIEHSITYEDENGESVTATVYSVYGGLDPTSVLATGTTVSKGQQIGVVGNATYSEDGATPGLHFSFIDGSSNSYLNPINIFITCFTDYAGGGICTYDDSGGLIISFPDEVLQYNQINYTVTCYNDYGWVLSCNDPTRISSTSLQNSVHKLWTAAGAKYTNGIATLKVNGVDRYLVATTQKIGVSGDLINAKLENGDIIPMVIADTKSYSHTGVSNSKLCDNIGITDPGCYGHFTDNRLSVLEFEVDPNEYNNNSNGRNPASWGQDWDVSQKVVSITRYGSIIGNSSTVNDICDNDYSDPSDPYGGNGKSTLFRVSKTCSGVIQPDRDGYPTAIISGRLDSHANVTEYNNAIKESEAKCASDGTRAQAVAVAVTTLNYAKTFNAKLPYVWNGGHGATGDIGVQGGWQKGVYGLDCSGFVRWVLNTTFNGQVVGSTQAESFDTINGARKVTLSSNEAVLRPGDLILRGNSPSTGHVAFIVQVDSERKVYIAAEAMGADYGIKYREYSFGESGYRGAALDALYGEKSGN